MLDVDTTGDVVEVPVENDTQHWVPPINLTAQLESPRIVVQSPTLQRSSSLQSFFASYCTNLIACPNPQCDFFFESTGPGDRRSLLLPNGDAPSEEALSHYQQFRHRCRKCDQDFCADCKKSPYHEGYTCREYEASESSVHCRFCDKLMLDKDPTAIREQLIKLRTNINTIVENVCDDCGDKATSTHDGVYPCHHQKQCTVNHLGSCPPCIHPDCTE